MMREEIDLEIILPTTAERLYNAWLNSKEHSLMTGAPAEASNALGGSFEAWETYISGRNLELIPFKRILQSWRSSDFKQSDPDSFLSLELEEIEGGVKLHLKHTDLPKGSRSQYLQGWQDFYFKPMQEYFERNPS